MYIPSDTRYTDTVNYRFCGKSGLQLPRLSLGLWHNFGYDDSQSEAVKMLHYAFDKGITHFDLANNYGNPYGSAERNFGAIVKKDFSLYRDELIISTKAGHDMWPGPYGNGGSRKYMIASINQSLSRMRLDYVDIFYSHRYDPDTPLEETMSTLADIVKQGKALYVGISKYPVDKAQEAYRILREEGTPCVAYQGRYSIFNREIEQDVLALSEEEGVGFIGFSPLAQGLLSDKYLAGIPKNSRAEYNHFLKKEQITPELIKQINGLNEIAMSRQQSLAQMALAWCLRSDAITSVIIGASSVKQLKNNIEALGNLSFTEDELKLI